MTDLNDRDRELVRLIDEHYAPKPLTGSERARLRLRLGEQLEPRVRRRWVPAAAATVALLGAAIFVFGPGPGETPPSEDQAEITATWAAELIYPPDVLGSEGEEALGEGELLPDDYLAIETLLAEG